MTTRIYVCRIEVDEVLCDFATDAAPFIEDTINNIDGCAVHSWDTEES